MYELRAKARVSASMRRNNQLKAARDIAVRDMLLTMVTELEKYVAVETTTLPDGTLELSGRIYVSMPNEVRRVVLPSFGVKGFGGVGAEIVEPIDPVPVYNPEKAASDKHVAKLLKVAVRKIQMGG